MVDEPCSDCDSNLSLDSLECKNAVVRRSQSVSKNVTVVPYYSGEVLIENTEHLKDKIKSPPKSLNSKIPSRVNKVPFKSHSTCSNITSEERQNGLHSFRPTFTYFSDEKPSKAINIERISRKTILPGEQIIRPRHKSVSYVEQFRKKMFNPQTLQMSTLSIADSEIYQSPSSESWENRDSGLGTSELEFSDDIMFLPQSTRIESFSELSEESEKSPPEKLSKTPKKNEKKPVLLKRVEVGGSEVSGNRGIEKKSSFERREEYATKVKLRNQQNFSRQRNKERANKPLKEQIFPEFHYKAETEVSQNISSIPFTCPFDVLGSKPRNLKTKKAVRTKFEKLNKKPQAKDEDMNIEMLRKRHEQEKQIVNSLRQLVIK